ncbi:MAG: hypothetical protein JJU32_17370 [Phormidium sp. BM_Day4_Bin.17]|nr:hypothetical protein [Phormidium sp. BM_Day4_Bin.17]UCJ12832.1 MAG: hypothetical protein JWS08_03235 [Phormidium sp. PBR-2020]
MRTSPQIIPSTPKSLGERQPWTLIYLTLAAFTVLTPLFSQLQQQSDSHQPLESTLVAGRGEESDKCVWLGICD